MRISNTSICSYPAKQQGFTLLELMVVIAMAAILTGMVILGFTGADAEQQLRGEANRFALRVELARQYALQRNREWGLFVEQGEYRFAEFDRDELAWIEQDSRPFGIFSPGEKIRLVLQATEVELPNDDEESLPDIIMFSSGEITPFELVLEPTWQTDPWVVSSDGIAQATVARGV